MGNGVFTPPVKYTRYFWHAPKTWVYRYPPPKDPIFRLLARIRKGKKKL